MKASVLRSIVLCVTSLGFIGFTNLANAAYQYTYSGRTITGIFTQYYPENPEPYNTPTTEPFTGAIFVQFTSPTLLTGPADLTSIGSFMMGGETTPSYYGNGTISGNWVYPYPYQVNAYTSFGELKIASVDANGLPTDWNIKMFGQFGYPRHGYPTFETTPTIDKIYGYSEYGSDWSGQTTKPGVWTVSSVSVVPEPETTAMLLAGLGLIGYVVRRRRAR